MMGLYLGFSFGLISHMEERVSNTFIKLSNSSSYTPEMGYFLLKDLIKPFKPSYFFLSKYFLPTYSVMMSLVQ